ncbi:dna polymerase iii -type-like protein, partial [Lasius niger]
MANLRNTKKEDACVVFLDLETSDLNKDCEILQIAAKYGEFTFATYIDSKQPIPPIVTKINGLESKNGLLTYRNEVVNSIPLKTALNNFKDWLLSFNKACYITAHNINFDGSRLYNAIVNCSMVDDFRSIVCGFVDTLLIIRKLTGRKRKDECTLAGLAQWKSISIKDAHNAIHDVDTFVKILNSLNISDTILIENAKLWNEQTNIWE